MQLVSCLAKVDHFTRSFFDWSLLPIISLESVSAYEEFLVSDTVLPVVFPEFPHASLLLPRPITGSIKSRSSESEWSAWIVHHCKLSPLLERRQAAV